MDHRWTPCISQPYFDRVERELFAPRSQEDAPGLYMLKRTFWEAISSWWGKSSNFSGECDWILPLPNIRLPNPWSYLLHKHQPDVSSLTWFQVWVPNKPMNRVPYVCIYILILLYDIYRGLTQTFIWYQVNVDKWKGFHVYSYHNYMYNVYMMHVDSVWF